MKTNAAVKAIADAENSYWRRFIVSLSGVKGSLNEFGIGAEMKLIEDAAPILKTMEFDYETGSYKPPHILDLYVNDADRKIIQTALRKLDQYIMVCVRRRMVWEDVVGDFIFVFLETIVSLVSGDFIGYIHNHLDFQG